MRHLGIYLGALLVAALVYQITVGTPVWIVRVTGTGELGVYFAVPFLFALALAAAVTALARELWRAFGQRA